GDLSRRLQIDGLSANHTARARCLPDYTERLELSLRDIGFRGERLACDQLESLRLQRVADENGDAVAVDDVQRRPATPERVVVHGWQVVVDQGVRVDELDGTGRWQCQCRGIAGPIVVDGVRGGER